MADLNPTLRVEANCQRVGVLAREKSCAFTMIQRGYCKGLASMSTKKASGYGCTPVWHLRPSACQRDSLVGDESRRQSGLGDFTLHFSGVLASLSWLPTHIRLPPSKCFSVAGASPGSFVLGSFEGA